MKRNIFGQTRARWDAKPGNSSQGKILTEMQCTDKLLQVVIRE